MANELTILLRIAEQSGDDAILDELVHDTAQEVGIGGLSEIADPADQDSHIAAIEALASDIYNAGYERQIEYLLQAGVSARAIEGVLRNSSADQR
jgi:hypothetical protein